MSTRREVASVVAAMTLSALALLVREPALGLVLLAGLGAATLLQARARAFLAALLALLGGGVLALGVARGDLVLGAGGLVAAAAATLATLRSGRWPPSRRGERVARHSSGRDMPARDTWDALDRGEDPTA